MRKFLITALVAAGLCQTGTAAAHNIIITNDDGLTSNVVALYQALKAEGHDVIVSVPCTNQSGMGAAIKFARPLAPIKEPCLNDAAKAGDAGAGPMTRQGLGADFHYVDGTPIMALLYGLDILAQERWAAEPDIVLSGPNEGQNLGAIILSSGTVSAAQFAAVKGLPAIALSAGPATEDADLANPASAKVAKFTADLVEALGKRAKGNRLLPDGIALNVNFPDQLDDAKWEISRIGNYNKYEVKFAKSMAETASPMMREMAKSRGMNLPDLPGLSIGFNRSKPTAEQMNDESAVYKNAIAISPMQAGYEYSPSSVDWLGSYLSGFVAETE